MYSIGIDLGGTKIAAAVADRQGHVRAFIEVPTHAKEGPVAVIHRMVEAARAVAAQAEATEGISFRDIQAVGIGAPGPLNPKTGFVYGPPNLPGWDAVHLQGEIEKQLSLPAFLDNDANAATLAEARLGAGQGFSDIVYVTVSTGIGGGVMLDGKVRHGHAGCAAEIGHQIIDLNGPMCQCGNQGCLEVLASGTAIRHMALERLGQELDARAVAELVLNGDRPAQLLLEDVYRALGVGLVNVMNMFDPAVIIIGGGVAQIGQLMFDALQTAVDNNRFRSASSPRVNVVPAKLGTKAGVIGAALLPWEAK